LNTEKNVFIIGANGQDGLILCSEISQVFPHANLIRVTSSYLHSTDKIEKYSGLLSQIATLKREFLRYESFDVYFLASKSEPDYPSYQSPNNQREYNFIESSTELRLLKGILGSLSEIGNCERFFYASSCLIFGDPVDSPQNEMTLRRPLEKYSQIKNLGTKLALEFGTKASTKVIIGILYTHESKFRPKEYLFPQLVQFAWTTSRGIKTDFKISDLNYARDWLDARDVMRAALLLMEKGDSGEYLIGSGNPISIGQILDRAFSYYGLNYQDYIVEDRGSEVLYRRMTKSIMTADICKLTYATGWREISSIYMVVDELSEHLESQN
jgi:GDPmannose 4,6-dehydratase